MIIQKCKNNTNIGLIVQNIKLEKVAVIGGYIGHSSTLPTHVFV